MFNLTLPNLGDIKRIVIGHDNWGSGAAWHLADVEVLCINTGQAVKFVYNSWLSRDDPPYQLQVELLPVGSAANAGGHLCRYSIVVYTSDVRGAGES